MITNFNKFKLNENITNNNWRFIDNRIFDIKDESIQIFDKIEGGGSEYDIKVEFSVLDDKPAAKLQIYDDNFKIFYEKYIVDFFC